MFSSNFRQPLDPDALAYCNASGATDIRVISNFVRGIKNLGLWNSVVCWPMRSAQNAGTGTTVYSLGGLGTYNGTLVNGPTWGPSGISFVTGAANYISTGFTFPVVGQTILNFISVKPNSSVVYFATPHAVNYSMMSSFSGNLSNGYLIVISRAVQNGQSQATYSFTSAVEFGISVHGLALNQLTTASAGGGFLPMASGTASLGQGVLELGSGDSSVAHTQSCAMILSDLLSDSDHAKIYSLYKSTLGQGLGLP